jgi:hypothetical protein
MRRERRTKNPNPVFLDDFAKSRRKSVFVIPAKAGIQKYQSPINYLDPGFRRGDDILQVHNLSPFAFSFSPLTLHLIPYT